MNNLKIMNIIHKIKFGSSKKEIDELAEKVIKGEKIATSSLLEYYKAELKQPSKVGDYAYILNSSNEEVAIVKINKIEIRKFKDISETFAAQEGDENLQNWLNIHHPYYSKQLADIEKELTGDTELVCEWFHIEKVLI